MQTLFSKIIIIGVGLLGGSVGLAARRSNLAPDIIGVCRSSESGKAALERGAVSAVVASVDDAVQLALNNDSPFPVLFVIGAPVGIIAEQVAEIADAVNACRTHSKRSVPILVTDVGSTKSDIVQRVAQRKLPPNMMFLGSHPIAGSEKSGARFADPDLFRNRVTVITPPEPGNIAQPSNTEPEPPATQPADAMPPTAKDFPELCLLTEFWQQLGSRVVYMTPEQHDSVLARTSHLPHLLSVALANSVPFDDLPFSGTGFFDMTRLADSNPDIWVDILLSNRLFLAEAVDLLEKELSQWKSVLEQNRRDAVITLLKEAKKKRNALGS